MERSNAVLDLTSKAFFDLKRYKHAKLFEGTQYPWEALKNIGSYLSPFIGNAEEIDLPLGVYIVHPETVYIEDDCIIEPGAYIQGPCYLGKGTIVRNGAYIRGYVVTGERCVIGHTTEIKNSILFDDVHAAHFNYIGDSILGNHVNLGAGAKIANLRLDGSEVYISIEGDRIGTGLRKFGAAIGDHSQIGCNAVTNPGTLIGPHSKWHPCSSSGGYYPANSTVK